MAKAKKEAVVKEPGMKGMVAHSDGSARPNPGFAGWGLHGYLYEAVEPTKGTGNPDYVLTENDYMTKTVKATLPNLALVTPLGYIDGYGALPGNASTNNAGELMGVTQAMTLALEQDVKKLRVWTDSEYVTNNMTNLATWQRNGWRLASGGEVKNAALWQDFAHAQQALKDKAIDFAVTWNRGHAGNFGNEIVDGLAFVGMRHATHGILDPVIKISSPEGYWKYETEKHPFICHRRMYYNTLPGTNKPGEYCLGEHDKNDDLAGKRDANGAYAYIRLTEPDKVLEAVREHSVTHAEGDDTVMIARLDYIYRAEPHQYLTEFGSVVLNNPSDAKSRLDAVIRNKKEPVTVEHNPPLLIARCEAELVQLRDILNDFLARPEEMVTTDLTPLIYESITETSKKGVEKTTVKLRPEFVVGTAKMDAVVNFRHPEGLVQQTAIDLILGLDLPDRNALRRLEEQQPKVTLITWPEEPYAFRFATIIQTPGAVGIFAGTYSNLRLIL